MELNAENLLLVRQKYQKQLVLPSNERVSATQFFVCPIGLVGAGKSTVMKPLSGLITKELS